MNNTINGKTPEEIKKGLECCNTIYGCKQCPYDAGDEDLSCCVKRNADVLALINQLQEDKKQLERERDEARNDLDTLNYANTELHSAYEAMKRERDELKNKPMAWGDVITTDSFLEVKDEYVGAALLQCAFSHDEYCADDEVTFTTHLSDLKLYYRSEYGKSWRCWPRFPTDEERAAAEWEVNENGKESS